MPNYVLWPWRNEKKNSIITEEGGCVLLGGKSFGEVDARTSGSVRAGSPEGVQKNGHFSRGAEFGRGIEPTRTMTLGEWSWGFDIRCEEKERAPPGTTRNSGFYKGKRVVQLFNENKEQGKGACR